MTDEIKVHVVKYPDRQNLVMRYRDPETGRQVQRSTGTTKQKEAVKAAAKWEAELREGRYHQTSRMTWESFRDYYSTNALPGLARSTVAAYETALNMFEAKCHPAKLANLKTSTVTTFTTKLREDSLSEATVAHYLRHLKAIARWAHRKGLLPVLPEFDMPKRAKGAKAMRGRPIVAEEFERMLTAVPLVVDNAAAASWKFYLRGLWASGLRLAESLTLRWDDAPDAIVVDLTGRRPMLRIPSEAEKGNRDRLLPMTPEFSELLQTVPEHVRHGRVFKLVSPNGNRFNASKSDVGRMVSSIGKKADVVVDERTKGKEVVRKFASAHDLRRGFGKRWAAKLKPTQLRELMRHASINTTLAYYVGEDAEEIADALWAGQGTKSGTSDQNATRGGNRHEQENA